MEKQDQFLTVLEDLGLKPQEAKVYFACLKLGQSTVGKIAQEANVQRTFVYDILSDLKDKAIVSVIEVRGKKNFSAVSIEQFKKIQQEKFKKFEHLMPELKAFEKTVGDRPRVRFFEGKEGVRTALYDTLKLPEGSEILAYVTGEGIYQNDPSMVLDYVKERLRKKIHSKAIASDNPETRKFTSQDDEQARETRLVPGNRFEFTNEINIYGNNVSIMSMKGELLAVIIESESIAKTQRMIFELAWEGAEKYNRMTKIRKSLAS